MGFLGQMKGMHSTAPGNLCKLLYVNTGKRVDFKYENVLQRLNQNQLQVFEMLLVDGDWKIKRLSREFKLLVGRLVELGLVESDGERVCPNPTILWSPSEKWLKKKGYK